MYRYSKETAIVRKHVVIWVRFEGLDNRSFRIQRLDIAHPLSMNSSTVKNIEKCTSGLNTVRCITPGSCNKQGCVFVQHNTKAGLTYHIKVGCAKQKTLTWLLGLDGIVGGFGVSSTEWTSYNGNATIQAASGAYFACTYFYANTKSLEQK